MIRPELAKLRGRRRHDPRLVQHGISLLMSCVPLCFLAVALEPESSSNDILAKVANSSAKSQTLAYSALREYRLRNFRFDKEARVSVQVTYRSNEGIKFTVLERSGSAKLTEIVEKLLASEAAASRPANFEEHEINPTNYDAHLRGTQASAGRICYVIDLVPKHKSKYLIRGTAWVDRTSYAIVRLEGVTAASLSMLVGTPHIQLEFGEIDGVWLPNHTSAVSSGLFLGTSELEISYAGYLITDLNHSVPSRAADSVQQTRP